MTGVATGGERERVTRALEELESLLGSLVGLLDEYERLRQVADAAQHERDRLREEVGRLQDEIERHRVERREIAASLTGFIEALSELRERL